MGFLRVEHLMGFAGAEHPRGTQNPPARNTERA